MWLFLTTYVLPFLIYWLIVFVGCYVVVEYSQNYLYDEPTPGFGLKLAVGTAILAGLLVWTRTSFDTMFTSELPKTVLTGIVWFAIFTLVFRFQPQHAVAIGLATMLLLTGVATLGVDSLTRSNQRTLVQRKAVKVMRQATLGVNKRAASPPEAAPPAPAKK
jgi:hypothetical protein